MSSRYSRSSQFSMNSICKNNCVRYNKLVTGANDPTISKAMRYSQLVHNYSYRNVQAPSKEIYTYNTPKFTNYFAKGR